MHIFRMGREGKYLPGWAARFLDYFYEPLRLNFVFLGRSKTKDGGLRELHSLQSISRYLELVL